MGRRPDPGITTTGHQSNSTRYILRIDVERSLFDPRALGWLAQGVNL
jgi:hypothetical protein